jgi:hypothetical protein
MDSQEKESRTEIEEKEIKIQGLQYYINERVNDDDKSFLVLQQLHEKKTNELNALKLRFQQLFPSSSLSTSTVSPKMSPMMAQILAHDIASDIANAVFVAYADGDSSKTSKKWQWW